MTKRQPWKTWPLLRWLSVAVWGILVLLLTTLPGDAPLVKSLRWLVGNTEVSDSVGHASLFLLLTALVWVALRQWFRARTALYLAMAFTLLLGTSTELFQWFVAGRYSSVADLLAELARRVHRRVCGRSRRLTAPPHPTTTRCLPRLNDPFHPQAYISAIRRRLVAIMMNEYRGEETQSHALSKHYPGRAGNSMYPDHQRPGPVINATPRLS